MRATGSPVDLSGLAQEVLPVIEMARAKWETQVSSSREPRSPGQASVLEWAEVGAGRVAEGGPDQQQPEMLRLF